MEIYPVPVRTGSAPIRVGVPGSKSITNRALLIGALAEGTSKISGILFSDDSRYFLEALKDLGFPVEVDEENCQATITGFGGMIPYETSGVYVGSAGTAARFLTALLGLSKGAYKIVSSDQMKKRPMQELLEALESLGARVLYGDEKYHFPFWISNPGITSNEVTVDVDRSSQFLSALLISSVLFKDGLTIHVTGSHGMAYVEMTINMMEQFGVKVEEIGSEELQAQGYTHTYHIPAGSAYQAMEYAVEPDMSAAAYFYAMGAVCGVPAMVDGVHSVGLQGDIEFLEVLQEMGCRLSEHEEGIICLPPADHQPLKGVDWDLSAFSDQALTLAAIAPFASTPVTIRGIKHIRHQECDRIHAILTNLQKMDVQADEMEEGVIVIQPCSEIHGARIETFDDHRVAMAFAIPGLKADGIIIENPGCCRKTFENYFKVLEAIL